MRLTRKQKITSAIAACAVGALAVIGGTYATFTASNTAAGQEIGAASSNLAFSETAPTNSFGATYSNLAAGDQQVSYIDLTNSSTAGSNSLMNFRISQVSTGDTTTMMSPTIGVGAEGLSVKVDRVDFGVDGVLGGTDDVLTPVIADVKLASLGTSNFLALGAPVAATEVAHLKFTVTLDQAATTQDQSLSTVYTVDANQVVTG